MRTKIALFAGAALAASVFAGAAQAQDTTIAWKGAPQFANDTLTFKVRGRVYLDYINQDVEPSTGATVHSSNTRVRTARLGVEGTWNTNWGYKVEASLSSGGGTTAWEDIMLEYKPNDMTSIMVGNFKTVSFENISSSRYITMMERGPFNDIGGIGRVASAQYKVNGETWTAAAFVNGDSINTADPAVGASETFSYGARGTISLLNTDTSRLHLGGWVRQRNRGHNGAGFTYAMRSNTAFGTQYLTTGAVGDRDFAYGLEALYINGPFSVQAEYENFQVTRLTTGLRQDIPAYYISASWFLTGEMRNLDVKKGELGRTRILNPITGGGAGAWELNLRYDNVDMTNITGAASAGEYTGTTIGLVWYPHPYTRFILNYTDGRNNLPGAAVDQTARTVQLRAQFDF